MQKHHFSIVLKAFIALNFLFFAACRNEVGVSDVDSKCVVGPNNLTGNVSETTADAGIYNIFWSSVPNTLEYEVKVFNESDNMRLIDSNITQNLENNPAVAYTCDSIIQRVRPLLQSGTLCIPEGISKRLSRPRGGITAVILERTSGSTCTGVTLRAFQNNGFQFGITPFTNSFDNGQVDSFTVVRTFNTKIIANVDSAGYLKIVRKNCTTGAIIGTRTEWVRRSSSTNTLIDLRNAILDAAGRAGVPNPTTNINAFLDSIRFEK